jgi:hypothetical protein
MGRFFDVIVLLGAAVLFLPVVAKLENLLAAVVLMGAGGVAGAAALRPHKARRALVHLALLRFRLRTVFVVMAVICATCALAPELRDFLVVFFVAFFSLTTMGRTLLS